MTFLVNSVRQIKKINSVIAIQFADYAVNEVERNAQKRSKQKALNKRN